MTCKLSTQPCFVTNFLHPGPRNDPSIITLAMFALSTTITNSCTTPLFLWTDHSSTFQYYIICIYNFIITYVYMDDVFDLVRTEIILDSSSDNASRSNSTFF